MIEELEAETTCREWAEGCVSAFVESGWDAAWCKAPAQGWYRKHVRRVFVDVLDAMGLTETVLYKAEEGGVELRLAPKVRALADGWIASCELMVTPSEKYRRLLRAFVASGSDKWVFSPSDPAEAIVAYKCAENGIRRTQSLKRTVSVAMCDGEVMFERMDRL